MSHRAVAGGVLLCILAALAAIRLLPEEEVLVATHAPPAELSPEAIDPLTLRALGTQTKRRATASGPQPETRPVAPPDLAVIRKARNRLAVSLVGGKKLATEEAGATLNLFGGDVRRRRRLVGIADESDTVWFDLGDSLHATAAMALHLSVRVPDHLPASTTLGWPDLELEVLANGQRIWRTALRLTPAIPMTGMVVDSSGRPVEGARVQAHATHGRHVTREPFAVVRSNDAGRFDIGVAPHAYTLLLADADPHAPGLARVLGLPAGSSNPGVEIRLARGHAVRGRILWQGESPPVGSWAIWFEIESAEQGVFLQSGAQGWWVDDSEHVHRAWGGVEAAEDGTFTLEGLSPQAYRLEPTGDDVSHTLDQTARVRVPVDDGALAAAGARVVPPVGDLVLDIRPAWLGLQVRAEGAKAINASVSIESEETGWGKSFDGPWRDVSLPVAPETTYTVEVACEGYEAVRQEVLAPGPGETKLIEATLHPRRVRTPVALRFTDPGEVGKTAFHLVPKRADGQPDDDRRTLWEVIEPVRGVYHIDLPSGHWRVVCNPGRTGSNDPPRVWTAVEKEIEVPEAGSLTVDLPLRTGALLRLRAASKDGRPLVARVRIWDLGGASQPVRMLAPSNRGWWSESGDLLSADGIGWTADPLAPGRYRIRMEVEGYDTWDAQIDVEAGKTISIDAVLMARN